MNTSSTPPKRTGASPDGLPPLREVIQKHGLRAKKSLSQNFLLDLNLTRRIACTAGDLSGKTVIEIGPGPGGLTRALLLEGADKVIALERDDRCLPALQEIQNVYPGKLVIHAADALKTNWSELCNNPAKDVIIAANLPYSIATKLLVGWLETEPWPPWYSKMVLMFQKEVAQRITAQPETKAYGRLAVIAQWRTNVQMSFNLNPEAFTPAPKVESSVVTFTPHPKPHPQCSVKTLSAITSAAFSQRRKMLRQSLKALLPHPENLLEATGISQTLRAEALTVSDFARLAYTFERLANRS